MRNNISAYLNIDLLDQAEKIYSISESLEQGSVDDGGFNIDKFQVPGPTTDMLISFANIGTINFIVLRCDVTLSVKINDILATPLVLSTVFPTVLSVAGINQIYVSNATDGSTDLSVFSAAVSE